MTMCGSQATNQIFSRSTSSRYVNSNLVGEGIAADGLVVCQGKIGHQVVCGSKYDRRSPKLIVYRNKFNSEKVLDVTYAS